MRCAAACNQFTLVLASLLGCGMFALFAIRGKLDDAEYSYVSIFKFKTSTLRSVTVICAEGILSEATCSTSLSPKFLSAKAYAQRTPSRPTATPYFLSHNHSWQTCT